MNSHHKATLIVLAFTCLGMCSCFQSKPTSSSKLRDSVSNQPATLGWFRLPEFGDGTVGVFRLYTAKDGLIELSVYKGDGSTALSEVPVKIRVLVTYPVKGEFILRRDTDEVWRSGPLRIHADTFLEPAIYQRYELVFEDSESGEQMATVDLIFHANQASRLGDGIDAATVLRAHGGDEYPKSITDNSEYW